MVVCYFCPAATDTRTAIQSWVSQFLRADGESVISPTCPSCAAVQLTKNENEEFVLVGADPVVEAVKVIAGKFFQWPLESRGSDSLDFHEVACWKIEEALTAAYLAGRAAHNRS